MKAPAQRRSLNAHVAAALRQAAPAKGGRPILQRRLRSQDDQRLAEIPSKKELRHAFRIRPVRL